MTPFRSALLLLALALPVAACGLIDDCSFPLEETEDLSASLFADVDGTGDTLSVVFVQGYEPELDVSLRAGAEREVRPSSIGGLVLRYRTRARTFRGETPALEATAVDGTAYVYLEGTFGRFQLTCSPPPQTVEVDVRWIEVPEGVATVSVSVVELYDLPPDVIEALGRPAARRAVRV